ncbi:MAG TPA: hypothetical protein VLM11_23205 [Streptosporangiaceae bacterium]|nr:hypothetical protein [Streptosporangiaceae bacterium]
MLQNDGGAAAADVRSGAAPGLQPQRRAHARGSGYLARAVALSADDRAALGLWAAAHLALLALAWASAWAFRATREHAPLTGAFEHWDAVLLRNIAQYGYFGPHTIANNTAFFPGYPAALAAGHLILRNWVLSELVVSGVAGCVAVVALARLARGNRAVLYLLTTPAVVFMMVGYAEALFLALAIPAWHAAARGRWWRAALFAALAGLVRPDTIFMIPALAVMALSGYRGPGTWPPPPARIRARLVNAAKVCCGLAGPAAYFAYLWLHTGNPLAWSAALRKGWDLHQTTPFQNLRTTWWAAFRHPFTAGTAFEFQLEFGAMAVMIVAVLLFLYAGRWPEATYCAVALVALGTSTWFETGPRTLLVLFPVWVSLAGIEARRPWVRYAYFGVSAPLAVVLGVLYLSGQWAG